MWLRHFLPDDLKTGRDDAAPCLARVMTFDYDVNVYSKAASQRSFTFAEDLLSALHDVRTRLSVGISLCRAEVSCRVMNPAPMRGLWKDKSSTTGVPETQELCGFTEEWDAGRHGFLRRSTRSCAMNQTREFALLLATSRTGPRLPILDQ